MLSVFSVLAKSMYVHVTEKHSFVSSWDWVSRSSGLHVGHVPNAKEVDK